MILRTSAINCWRMASGSEAAAMALRKMMFTAPYALRSTTVSLGTVASLTA